MADIFVSCAQEDRPAVAELVRLLGEPNRSVWWDRQLIAGAQFDQVIDKELSAARLSSGRNTRSRRAGCATRRRMRWSAAH
jgi:hypothetical protein